MNHEPKPQWWHGLVIAFQFLTKMPLPLHVPYVPHTVSRSLRFYPLVGMFIGLIVYAVAVLLPAQAAPLNAAVALLVWTLLTGGLHMDGWMDTADAFGSHRDRARMLEIMKDSRVGAMGVIAAIFLLLLKWAALWMLLACGTGGFAGAQTAPGSWLSGGLLFGFVTIPAVSRWCMVAAIIRGSYIGSAGGLGSYFSAARVSDWVVASCFCLAGLCIVPSASWLAVTAVQLGVAWLAGRYVTGKLGGWTGDTYGALNEAVELAGLLAAAYLMLYMAA
ncbi:adenosylcobinamide-GDP ribazoletransferase [Paenibacillus thalictri]|uniref:Adenosylcobinamide-GDP ribazoletransferase n=1 Tax=Paenibacillus thalictri TaxID=2527873 RepID=A0A4Q9DSB5_9BACL|nr:adenosylcobinamide-GDP ribazoletransferase [Paenibacillus thalictri]TBL78286.1 adenosylcobinamide-GDP ribazoletransferase [Paenibacillus thalictri]